MIRLPVVSSNLASVGYSALDSVLEIEFHSGGVYQCYAVPESIYLELIVAPSKGTYFHEAIRDVFRYKKMR